MTTTTDDTDDTLSALDRAALERCVALTLEEGDLDRREQIEWKIHHSGWLETALFASYHQQYDHLHLKPWESTPCLIKPDDIGAILRCGPHHNRQYGAAKLLKRMLSFGVSQYDPTPLESIEAARHRKATP